MSIWADGCLCERLIDIRLCSQTLCASLREQSSMSRAAGTIQSPTIRPLRRCTLGPTRHDESKSSTMTPSIVRFRRL